MYQVPASRSSVVQFVITCPGMSHSSTFTLHMRDNGEVDDGKVWGDLCREKTVNIAYINTKMGRGYEVNNETGDMVRYKVNPMTGYHSYISYHWEILDSFFKGGFQTLKLKMLVKWYYNCFWENHMMVHDFFFCKYIKRIRF